MRRNASLRKQALDTPEAAAGQAGRSIDQWIAAALAEQASRTATREGTGIPADTSPDPKARRGARGRAGQERDEYESLIAAAAASERRAIETAGKTAVALGSVASWIERAQERLTETTAAASKAQQATAAVVSGAVGAIGQRLEAIERKVEKGGTASVAEALRAIERLESRLAAQPLRVAPDEPRRERDASPVIVPETPGPTSLQSGSRPEEMTGLDVARRSFQARISELGAAPAPAPAPPTRRALARPDDLQGAVAEIRARQAALAGSPAPVHADPRPAAPQDLQTEILTSLQADLAKLTGQLETIRPAVTAAPEMLRDEIETLRRSLDSIATRHDLGRIEDSLQSLSEEVAEARASGGSAALAAREIEALQAEIRRLETTRSPEEERRLQRDVETLTRKLDIAAASGIDPGLTDLLTRQLREIRDMMAGVASPDALTGLANQLAALKGEVAQVGERQIALEEFTSLRRAVEEMRSSLAVSQADDTAAGWQETARQEAARQEMARQEAARQQAASEGGKAIEAMLLSLMDKLDRVERKVPDPDALDQLEQQVEKLAARVAELGGHDPAMSALEGSMGDLLREVATWRDGAAEAAERAARLAVVETLGSLPRPIEIERHLNELMAQYEAAEQRTQGSLAGVHTRLEDVVRRMSSLEGEVASARPDIQTVSVRAASARTRADDVPPGRMMEAASRRPDEAGRGRPPAPAGAELLGSLLQDADRPVPPAPAEEILLEPGAGRPRLRVPGVAEPGSDPSDIKSSFIAAARRAAQAASAEIQEPAKPSTSRVPSGVLASLRPAELAERLLALFKARRRPLLIGAAVIALALGALGLTRGFLGAPAPAMASRTEETSTRSPAAPTRQSPSAPAGPSVRPDLADPVTTQSIGPRRSPASEETRLAAPRPAAQAAVEAVAAPPFGSALAVAPVTEDAASKAAPASATIAARSPVAPEPGVLPAGLRNAATAGNPVALFELASRTAEGRGVPRDPKAAAGLFEKAAEQGLAPAQYRIGNIYERGVGVTRDVEAARSWYRRAAESGNIRAMHNLAVLIAEGGGGKSDYPAAIGWFQKAADHGVRDSQFNLAVLHARGLGVPQDLVKAYLWLAISASGGDEDAGKKRDELAAKLSPTDLQRAKAAFERWRPNPANPAANEVQIPPAGWPDLPVKRASR